MRVSDYGVASVRHGDSLDDVVQYIRATPPVWRARSSAASERSHNWDFGLGYDGALALALKGWPDGTDRLVQGVRAVPPPQAIHHKRMFDVGGDFPDVGRFLSGTPDSMVRRGRQTGIKPVIHLVVNIAAGASVTSQQFLTMGTAMALVIDQLEASGRRVELDAFALANVRAPRHNLIGWKVKKADDHLDFGALAFSFAHPAALRRIGFALYERMPISQESYTYGYAEFAKEAHMALIDAERALCINMSYSDCNTTSAAVKTLASIINEAAGETIVEVDNA